ncbi:hypothetical protein M2427_008071 [Bradyrhizobium sp. BR13661]|jgi:hypothetical protein|nr:hypothetical protein [Bradyrhizobium sp. BR13661]
MGLEKAHKMPTISSEDLTNSQHDMGNGIEWNAFAEF